MPNVFSAPYDWPAIDLAIECQGAVVLEGFVNRALVQRLHAEADAFLAKQASVTGGDVGLPTTNSTRYNRFLGHKTVRLHGLLEKFPSAVELIDDSVVLDWAARLLSPLAAQPRLSAAEFIQIEPQEPRQLAHRDSDSWPLPVGEHPLVVNAIIALTEFTAQNGATWIAPGSFKWPVGHAHQPEDFLQAVMGEGDALLFRGDLVHGAGANNSDATRRAISLSFCAGWLRAVENSALNLQLSTVRSLSVKLQAALGFAAYDGSGRGNGLLGLYENGDPAQLLRADPAEAGDDRA